MSSRYRVSGPFPVLGHEPGKRFEADIDPVHEARLIDAGHLTKLAEKSGEKTTTTGAAPADPKE